MLPWRRWTQQPWPEPALPDLCLSRLFLLVKRQGRRGGPLLGFYPATGRAEPDGSGGAAGVQSCGENALRAHQHRLTRGTAGRSSGSGSAWGRSCAPLMSGYPPALIVRPPRPLAVSWKPVSPAGGGSAAASTVAPFPRTALLRFSGQGVRAGRWWRQAQCRTAQTRPNAPVRVTRCFAPSRTMAGYIHGGLGPGNGAFFPRVCST